MNQSDFGGHCDLTEHILYLVKYSEMNISAQIAQSSPGPEEAHECVLLQLEGIHTLTVTKLFTKAKRIK